MNSVHLAPNLTLIHGDCLEYMATLADGAYSLAVVDPPYGIHEKLLTTDKNVNRSNKFALMYQEKGWDTKRPTTEYFDELMRVTKNQVICGGNYFASMLPASRGWAIWDKQGDGMTTVNNELIYTSLDLAMKTFRRCHGLDKGFMNPEKSNIHPTQKPVALYRWLLQNYARPGDTILDTHLGSGSSAIAAWEMGYTFTGIEIDRDYFDAAVERIRKRMSQPYLPGIVQPKAEQASLF